MNRYAYLEDPQIMGNFYLDVLLADIYGVSKMLHPSPTEHFRWVVDDKEMPRLKRIANELANMFFDFIERVEIITDKPFDVKSVLPRIGMIVSDPDKEF